MRPLLTVATTVLVVIGGLTCAVLRAQEPLPRVPGTDWEHATPASQGFSPEGLAKAVAIAKQAGSTSGLVVHDGLIVAEWGDVSRTTNLHSVRKSFASALVGIAVAREQLRLDDTLAQLDVDDEPPALSPTERQATLRMLRRISPSRLRD
jgi:CubicO group peptidase (beta-lactamase class C family)